MSEVPGVGRVLSGGMHYFRVHPDQWPDRLAKLRAMGLDTVETYVPWNLHEPRPGAFRFEGLADLEGFLRAAATAGLRAIVRPGPYICAEWDNGGLPSWLPGPLRCHDPAFLEPVDRYFDALVPRLARHQVTRGGNVIMVQVENEYGSYGDDRDYLRHLTDGLRRRGVEVPLFTSDGATDWMLTGGTLPGVWATVNFGSRAAEQFAVLARHRPEDPPFCMEYWNGWFDHHGERHTTRDPQDAAAGLEEILRHGASVNLYMACGGTNFGFTAGANADGDGADGAYQPTVTSYDYDAPIAEDGRLTPKYRAYREVLARHTTLPPAPSDHHPDPLPPGPVALPERLPLDDCLDALTTGAVRSATPRTLEELGESTGLVLYRTRVPGPREEDTELRVKGLRDWARVTVDGRHLAVLERDGRTSVPLRVPEAGAELTLLVEAMGRINYGPPLGERKGIVDGVLHGRQYLFGWEQHALPLSDLTALPWERAGEGGGDVEGPAFHRGTLTVERPADTYLALPGWGKGCVWVNGFPLGRYWNRGPQRTLYVPAPVLRPGENEWVVLELERAPERPVGELRAEPDLGPTA
ncbi:beta-galactosidase family protein [Streptomyces sp. NPDC005438]|uniref:glycoside hydrolase family 35 protein n=1 Tax=Streptomyces sp. NPDC005438 TaxID=3156880 RepID=UPI0033BECF1F